MYEVIRSDDMIICDRCERDNERRSSENMIEYEEAWFDYDWLIIVHEIWQQKHHFIKSLFVITLKSYLKIY